MLTLNGISLSANVLGYNPLILPSFGYVAATSNRQRKNIDFGTSADKFVTQIELALTQSEFINLNNSISASNGLVSLDTTLDLFFPLSVMSSITVGVKSFKDEGWKDELHTLKYVLLELVYLSNLSFNETSTSAVQSFLDRATISQDHDEGIYSPLVFGPSYTYSKTPIKRSIEISQSLFRPYQASSFMKWYLTNRASYVSLTLSNRHDPDIVTPTGRNVVVSDVRLSKEGNFYSLSAIITF